MVIRYDLITCEYTEGKRTKRIAVSDGARCQNDGLWLTIGGYVGSTYKEWRVPFVSVTSLHMTGAQQ
jgi:hypothetical protein